MAEKAVRYAFVSSTDTIPTTGTTRDLATNQVGVFDAKTFIATDGNGVDKIIIASGRPSEDLSFAGFNNYSTKTKPIGKYQIKSFKKKEGTVGHGQVWEMGDLAIPKVNTVFEYSVSLTGGVINRLKGLSNLDGTAWYPINIAVELPCQSGCETVNCSDLHDQNLVADAAIEAHKQAKLFSQSLNDFIKIEKVVTGATSGLATVTYDKFTLTIVDGGGEVAFAQVQAAYPGYVVKQLVSGLTSVYEIIVPDGVTPDPYSNQAIAVIPNCSTCPDGYTLQAAQDSYIVSRSLLPTDDISTPGAQTTYADGVESDYSATASKFLSNINGQAIVQLWFATGSTVNAIDSDIVTPIGVNEPICTLDTPTTTAWTADGSCIKGIADFTLTVKDTDCGGNYLAQLQAEYASVGTVTLLSSANCTSVYNIAVESENYDCDACGDDAFSWITPASFEGNPWIKTPTPNLGGTVKLRFTEVYVERQIKECFYREVTPEIVELFFTVVAFESDFFEEKYLCTALPPSKQIRGYKAPFGLGIDAAQLVYESNFRAGWYWSCDPATRDAINYALGIDFSGLYDQYVLEVINHPDTEGGDNWKTHHQIFETSVFFRKGTGTSFETVIGAFAANNGVTLEIL